ncbi:MAG TPA: cellulose biosynthesis protein BcsS [Lysobacter sp.]|nr:cellulose biosynthesis protein BcsS [Lysobacter sp.]
MLIGRGLLAAGLCCVAHPAIAESVWIAGASVAEETDVGWLGRVGPLPGKRLADGWSQSIFVDYVSYEYDAGTQRINGTAKGIKFSIGREFRVERGYLGLGLGVGASQTRLSPDDPGNSNRGTSVHPVGEFQWRSDADATWRSRAYAQYVFGARRSYANAFVGRLLPNGMALGPQLSTGGDPSYRIYGLALALDGWKLGPLDVGVYAGAQHSEGGSTHPEFGFSFSLYRGD